MSGIKLKSNKISPIKVERIKWVMILLLSHFFMQLLQVGQKPNSLKVHSPVREGYTRLQLQIQSKVPITNKARKVTLLNKELEIISKDSYLIKKITSETNLGELRDIYLIEVPEQDLNTLIKSRNKGLLAYPSSKKIISKKTKTRKKTYEIYF